MGPPVDLFGDDDLVWEDDVVPRAQPSPRRPAAARRPAPARRRVPLAVAAAVLAVALGVGLFAALRPHGRPASLPPPPRPRVRPKPPPLPPSISALVPQGTALQLGDRGLAVRAIRARLHVRGLGTAFDAAPRAAVVGFQQAHALAADGVVGPATARALDELAATGATSG